METKTQKRGPVHVVATSLRPRGAAQPYFRLVQRAKSYRVQEWKLGRSWSITQRCLVSKEGYFDVAIIPRNKGFDHMAGAVSILHYHIRDWFRHWE